MSRQDRRREKRKQKRERRDAKMHSDRQKQKHDLPGKWLWWIAEVDVELVKCAEGTAMARSLSGVTRIVSTELDKLRPGLFVFEIQGPTGKSWRKAWSTFAHRWATREEYDDYLKEKRRARAHALVVGGEGLVPKAAATTGDPGSEPGAEEIASCDCECHKGANIIHAWPCC